jgi:hypothetical protein
MAENGSEPGVGAVALHVTSKRLFCFSSSLLPLDQPSEISDILSLLVAKVSSSYYTAGRACALATAPKMHSLSPPAS